MTAPNSPARKPSTHGPVSVAVLVGFGLFSVTVSSWLIGLVIEIGGGYFFWRGQGIRHAQEMVQQDLRYIAAAPRSLLVPDTVDFSLRIVKWVRMPYERLGALRWYQRNLAAQQAGSDAALPSFLGQSAQPQLKGLAKAGASFIYMLSEWVVISMFVLQDVLLRLCTAVFALPAFALACLMGVIDGLVRRDRRRWQGGRESSFVYHHAKRYVGWALTGGFGLYLSWPFGGFNPAYMVLVFTVLVAFTLSTTVGAFKKYA
ncbi:TIGR03747 family integrating conjugative element membrane protein [Comamonas sp. E6]|uniref:TIGR03747 family integrating conjugative element membrane protein n=1 Tax=Comamonas sp. E6 TaxID=364029 RepID=UPI00063275C4|nr:TIGR03747 family integrating conjugative element membrane protein [Comamonas sp. E6]GAO72875.1 hypothetical protein CSE6_027_43120 [Comamonas sp. E6]